MFLFLSEFSHSDTQLLGPNCFGVPGVKRTLGEVKVQGSDVAAVCENVSVATSHPGIHRSHCCRSYSSRWVIH